MKWKFELIATTVLVFLLSCQNKPKVIVPVNNNTQQTTQQTGETGIFSKSDSPTQSASTGSNSNSSNSLIAGSEFQRVTVKEVLPTEKYVYLFVNSGEDEFWIATGKQEVEVGKDYVYKNGLLKTNFESKEYNRIFDKVYLVSRLIPADHGQSENTIITIPSTPTSSEPATIDHPGNFQTIREIVSNPNKFKDKEVLITGQCVKLNANIMGRNWIHLDDRTNDNYDFVVTSNTPVPEGQVVKMKGILKLDQDFGAGYRYELIVENASLVTN